jgi:hypothetical protein
LEQRAIEAAGGAVIDVLDGGLMAQPGIAQEGEQAPVTPIANLLIEQQGRAITVAASPAASISPKAWADGVRGRLKGYLVR